MGLYARHVLPKLIDAACAQKPMSELRACYVPRLRGRVLEIGFGTGHNLKHYASGDAAPESLHALEPAPDIVALASARIAQAPFPVEVLVFRRGHSRRERRLRRRPLHLDAVFDSERPSRARGVAPRSEDARPARLHRTRREPGPQMAALAEALGAGMEVHRRRLPLGPPAGSFDRRCRLSHRRTGDELPARAEVRHVHVPRHRRANLRASLPRG